ncbi:hypothetical protein EYR27_00850 [Xanthomonas oryzae]|nr:hypothetical protein EYR27_00850 [Xanthomonas oryzae]
MKPLCRHLDLRAKPHGNGMVTDETRSVRRHHRRWRSPSAQHQARVHAPPERHGLACWYGEYLILRAANKTTALTARRARPVLGIGD